MAFIRYASPYIPERGAILSYLTGHNEMLENAEKTLEALTKGYPQKLIVCYGLGEWGKLFY